MFSVLHSLTRNVKILFIFLNQTFCHRLNPSDYKMKSFTIAAFALALVLAVAESTPPIDKHQEDFSSIESKTCLPLSYQCQIPEYFRLSELKILFVIEATIMVKNWTFFWSKLHQNIKNSLFYNGFFSTYIEGKIDTCLRN